MTKSEREELHGYLYDRISHPQAIKDLEALFADYDALKERLEGMTTSSEAAHTYAEELEAKLAEAGEHLRLFRKMAGAMLSAHVDKAFVTREGSGDGEV
jgi:DNA repair ATPase RecN